MKFIDLKAQYDGIRADINQRIQRVLEHGQYINGPEVAELERLLPNSLASNTLLGSPAVRML